VDTAAVRYSLARGVALVELNRPERRNALDFEMVEALHAAMVRACEDREARVIVLTGVGDAFCVGVDGSRLAQAEADAESKDARQSSRRMAPVAAGSGEAI
jgi:enoyl-CoA hydratase/carnithine racemase